MQTYLDENTLPRCSELFENTLACIVLLSGTGRMLNFLQENSELPGLGGFTQVGFELLQLDLHPKCVIRLWVESW